MNEKKSPLLTKKTSAVLAAVLSAILGSGYFAIPAVQGWAEAVTDVRIELAEHELESLKEERRNLRRDVKEFPDDVDSALDLDDINDLITEQKDKLKCLRAGEVICG